MKTRTHHRNRPTLEALEGRALLSAGDLDLTFGNAGLVTRDFGAADSTDQALALAVQSDGKILVGSRYLSPGSKGSYDFAVARFNADGSIDTGFGTGGLATVDFTGMTDVVRKVVVDSSTQKIILIGDAGSSRGQDFGLARLNPNGTLDTTFGSRGKVQVSVDNYDGARDVALDSRGRIVVAGTSGTYPNYVKNTTSFGYEDVLLRFNPNGSLDTAFGSGGKVVGAQGAGTGDSWGTLRMLPDDSISALGTDARQGVVAHFTAAGVRDRRVVLTPPANPYSSTVALSSGGNAFQPDGKILSVQTPASTYADQGVLYLVRYNSDGTVDSGFGTGGVAMTDLRVPGDLADLGANGVTFAADGRIVVGGSYRHYPAGAGVPYHSLLIRYNADGSLDDGSAADSTPGDSFGSGGVVIQALSPYGSDAVTRLAILPDGKILTAGYADTSTAVDSNGNHVANMDVALARFLGDSPALLRAASAAPSPVRHSLAAAHARPALARARAYWRARGADVARLGRIDLAIADLGGDVLGRASGSTITLDDNAAGWGWSIGRAASGGRGVRPGRMDLVSALAHEVGHLLGHDHAGGGVMAESLAPGVRLVPADRGRLVPAAVVAPTSQRSAIEAFRARVGRPTSTVRA